MTIETRQYMTFKLGDELFAIDVAQVREVLEVSQITKVPTAPEYMRGVVNVRGQATPVVDLRVRFGLPKGADTVNTRVIVMELELDGEATVLGVRPRPSRCSMDTGDGPELGGAARVTRSMWPFLDPQHTVR